MQFPLEASILVRNTSFSDVDTLQQYLRQRLVLTTNKQFCRINVGMRPKESWPFLWPDTIDKFPVKVTICR